MGSNVSDARALTTRLLVATSVNPVVLLSDMFPIELDSNFSIRPSSSKHLYLQERSLGASHCEI